MTNRQRYSSSNCRAMGQTDDGRAAKQTLANEEAHPTGRFRATLLTTRSVSTEPTVSFHFDLIFVQ